MPSGGRGYAPPKSAQWLVSHYRIITSNASRRLLTACKGRCPLTPDGKPKSSASGKPWITDNNTLRNRKHALNNLGHTSDSVGLPPAGAAVGVSHVVVCVVVRNAGAKLV